MKTRATGFSLFLGRRIKKSSEYLYRRSWAEMQLSFVTGIYHAFIQKQSVDEAKRMSEYMRGQFQYFGIRAPQMKEVLKQFIKENGYPKREDIKKIIHQLYNQEQRELQIVALAVMDYKLKKFPEFDDIELMEYMIVTKPWWDTVDHIASNQVGHYFKKFPEQVPLYIEKWVSSSNIWLKRTAILFQLKYKQGTDFELLQSIIIRCQGSNEFFINKAIGWALREYSKINKDAVVSFATAYEKQLSNLSIREGLKWLRAKKLI
jgi:3-methyladenine DNA glycosylase AlkD